MTENHSWKMGGEMPMPNLEQNQLAVKKVTLEDFSKMLIEIHGLSRTALGESGVRDVDFEYLEATKRGELFVGMKDGVVVAAVSIKKNEGGSEKTATVNQIRFAAGLVNSEEIVAGVLHHVKEVLENKEIHHLEVGSERDYNKLSLIESSAWLKKATNVDNPGEKGVAGADSHA